MKFIPSINQKCTSDRIYLSSLPIMAQVIRAGGHLHGSILLRLFSVRAGWPKKNRHRQITVRDMFAARARSVITTQRSG
jgi:hypothetical protein